MVVIPNILLLIVANDIFLASLPNPSDRSIKPLAAVNADIAFSSNLPNTSDSTPSSPKVPTVASKPPAKPNTAA